jgi:hypothetical protein
MYGDTEAIRGLARTLRDQSAALRAEGATLLDGAETAMWQGLAAEAMRWRVREQVAALARTAGLAEEAATALEEHADEVDRLKALIAAIEQRVLALVAAARDRLGGLLDAVLPDPLDELLARFVPPPSGHRDWLTVELPGLAVAR